LQQAIPQLSRSALHCLFQRHGISRLPAPAGPDGPVGYSHVDFAEVRTEDGRQYLFVAIDHTSKLAFAELHPEATALRAADFWRRTSGGGLLAAGF